METVAYTYRFRLYPTADQQARIKRHLGAQRFVWNYFLSRRKMLWQTGKIYSSFAEDCKILTDLKRGFLFLQECNAQALQQVLVDLDEAHVRAYTKKMAVKTGHPRLKKKRDDRSTNSICNKQYVAVNPVRELLRVPKFQEGIPIVLHRPVEGIVKRASVTLNAAGQYHASILVQRQMPVTVAPNAEVGIDLGIKTLAFCSTGQQFAGMSPYRQAEKKIQKLQRSLSRKKKGCANHKRAKLKLARAHLKARNQRNDYLHKVSHQIVSENQAIYLETLNVSGMVRNRCLAKSLHDSAMATLAGMIKYKARWYGRTVGKINRFFPSSKTCSFCGLIKEDLTLSDREWRCEGCGVLHDRDRNAANNILIAGRAEGIAVLNACGGNAPADERKPVRKRFRRSTKPEPDASPVG